MRQETFLTYYNSITTTFQVNYELRLFLSMGRITNFIDVKYITESACASGQRKSGYD